jgi:hypothetical protein
MPITPFTPKSLRSPRLLSAWEYIDLKSMICFLVDVVRVLQRGQSSLSPVGILHLGQNFVGWVRPPQSHLGSKDVFPQLVHFLTPSSTSITPFLSFCDV